MVLWRDVLPAYAGMILPPYVAALHRVRAPRVCGDDFGTHRVPMDVSYVLPAYAGMIPSAAATCRSTGRAPRVCGDDPFRYSNGAGRLECSPRMRG